MFEKKYDKKLIISLIISLTVYTLTGWIMVIIYGVYSDLFPTNLVKWIYLRKDLIMILYLVVGYISIFLIFWNKLCNYIREIENAMSVMYKKDDSVVKLSEPLKSIEEKMNAIKMDVILAEKAIEISENKKKEFIAYLAHDLRTPLTSIVGYLDMINETPDMPEKKRQKYILGILDKAKYMEQLINNFFEITQYSMGQISLQKNEINLYYMLFQLSDEFIPMCLKNNNSIRLDIDENFMVKLDSEKMARVFENLLKNAISYSYSNTEILISARKKDNNLEILFKNAGETLTKDEMDKIFKKFGRLSLSRCFEVTGSGLGLSIVKEIVELHGGTIVVDSYDEQIIFIINLPYF